jgi:phosphoenolpyruvate carboxylase
MKQVSARLKTLVDESVTVLGEVVRAQMGERGFKIVESLRSQMAALREADYATKEETLRRNMARLQALTAEERLDCARAFTLMLELMNACENAYRNFSIRFKDQVIPGGQPDAVIYVLTAHPTEARDPANISIFHQIQQTLTEHLVNEGDGMTEETKADLLHLVHLAWRRPVVRPRKPKVQDEADHIFSTLLREETLRPLLRATACLAPLYIRSWVGGDKDGHPGVNAATFRGSLQLSRGLLVKFACLRVDQAVHAAEDGHFRSELARVGKALKARLREIRQVKTGDGGRIKDLRRLVRKFSLAYEKEVGAAHPGLKELERSLRIFPGFVVPLEFRESSDMLEGKKSSAIFGMLKALGEVSRGGDPRWYVRGLIVSMSQNIGQIRQAAALVRKALGAPRIPVIPLFEQAEDLERSPAIVGEMLKDSEMKKARARFWGGYLEVMVGYSDSSKQSGVLPSRMQIAEVMHILDRLIRKEGVTPIFFQGSGGSVDRGGGSVPEQTAWWPAGALRNYKVTVQGEMVERSFASAEIAWRQLERICAAAGAWKNRGDFLYRPDPALRAFAASVAQAYRSTVADPSFLAMVEAATPYSFLDKLRIGSRPSKRKNLASVSDLRAIPWVLCWTQTRVLFPTWWGVGSAWSQLDPAAQKKLREAYGKDPVFGVFVRALAYTMAKVEMPVWALYLERSGLPNQAEILRLFKEEEKKARAFLAAVKPGTGAESDRGWLYESIRLRSPMIHPLNLLQLIALRNNESDLLRMTVTGIASGMVATG